MERALSDMICLKEERWKGKMNEKISPEVQEYLETIYKLHKNGAPVGVNEIVVYLKIDTAAVMTAVDRLVSLGYAIRSPAGVILTDAGLKLGLKMNRKHRLLESFLQNVLGIGRDKVHREACEMEHTLSDETEVALCRFLGHPGECPDDRQPIQPCDL
jgi:DtxR family Mn-dependent transcriptional regulator